MRVESRAARALAVSGLLAVSSVPVLAQEKGSSEEATAAFEVSLAAIREATSRYTDVQVALADGYVPDPTNTCVTAGMVGFPAEAGSMGIHYFDPKLLGVTVMEPRVAGSDATLEWTRPEVLLYEPQPDGSLALVGVEYLVFEGAWNQAGNDAPPDFHGSAFTRMVDDPATVIDEAHAFEPHYELHLWTIRENPTGATAEFNPNVICPAPDAGKAHAGKRHDR